MTRVESNPDRSSTASTTTEPGMGPLWTLLKETSRSFYLTLRVLPTEVRSQIGLAYLLARATDTVADTQYVPIADRLAALAALRERILGMRSTPLDLTDYATSAPGGGASATAGERELMRRIEEAILVLGRVSKGDRMLIDQVLTTITSGQELDLVRFGAASSSRVLALNTAEELDDYTYRVAGCVGEFWTRICGAHLMVPGDWDETAQVAQGIRFGQGLQLVNILRDLPKDLREGRCYLPAEDLARLGIRPQQLLEPRAASTIAPLYGRWLDRAEAHLEAGWTYTLTIPKRHRRVRWGCALPILIGVRTLRELRKCNPLSAPERVKVSRGFVRSAAWGALLAVWGMKDWTKLLRWARDGA